ncbi:acriflavin resistance protein [Vibrio nigripulchritudo]|uniref:efflux RND transporter periplasmic adaptor subunit n=1 Tax=Vibrio nigripulchritudo TaxID=28173 RepID=UPI001909B622|nr:HlyD family secretion protein [Vibrio nigripulchritudo]BCL68595.1 acriflavin resistance protein [Vibrio nigripulchritudo]BDU29925.1 acriflavin resistance protein [Vibrio nigripulchritudo]
MALKRKLLFFPALTVGIVILILAINLRPTPSTKPAGDRSRLVETMPLELKSMAPAVIGFGTVTPKLEWKAIAEVSGKVVYRHPQLENGRMLKAGTEILRIDPLDYELKLAQAEADLSSSQTKLAKLDLEQTNLTSTLKIEENRLAISKTELERKKNLRKKGLTSQSDVDQQNQSYLSQQKLVQDIQNQLALFPDERKVSHALVKVNQSKLKEAQRSLEKTSVILPQDMRISKVDIEVNQVVNLQQTMVVAHGVKIMEVEAQLAIHDMRTLIYSLGEFERDENGVPNPDTDAISASIELTSGSLAAKWDARLTRVSETVDPNQATVGVILEIEQDYRDLKPQNSPPLVNGMFVKAEIIGQENPSWVIPERALHGSRIYLKDQNSTLRIQPVTVLYRRDNKVVIEGDIEQGELLILNDLLPAIEGMQLKSNSNSEARE